MSAQDQWEKLQPLYQREWDEEHSDTGVFWPEIAEGFRYGWLAARSPQYADCSWEKAEADLRQHWFRPELESEEVSWDYVRDAVHEGWEKGRALSLHLGYESPEWPGRDELID